MIEFEQKELAEKLREDISANKHYIRLEDMEDLANSREPYKFEGRKFDDKNNFLKERMTKIAEKVMSHLTTLKVPLANMYSHPSFYEHLKLNFDGSLL